MIKWIKSLYLKINLHIQYKKRLKEIKKRDPFIYK
jgi:hypothetical protein